MRRDTRSIVVQAQPGRLHHNGRMSNAGIIGIIGIIVVQASRLLLCAAKMAAPQPSYVPAAGTAAPQGLRLSWHPTSLTHGALLRLTHDPVASCLICTKRVVHTSSLFACSMRWARMRKNAAGTAAPQLAAGTAAPQLVARKSIHSVRGANLFSSRGRQSRRYDLAPACWRDGRLLS